MGNTNPSDIDRNNLLNTFNLTDDIQGVEHLANYNSQIKKVCYEKFLDGPVTYEQAKAKCAAMGYILAEIYTPEQLEAFHLVVESACNIKSI